MGAQTLYAQLKNNLWLLENRSRIMDSYINEPEKWLGTRPVYTEKSKAPLLELIEETKAAIKGIEEYKASKHTKNEQNGTDKRG